ncbi:uncharacterized protein LOC144308414 [Canis aureus]
MANPSAPRHDAKIHIGRAPAASAHLWRSVAAAPWVLRTSGFASATTGPRLLLSLCWRSSAPRSCSRAGGALVFPEKTDHAFELDVSGVYSETDLCICDLRLKIDFVHISPSSKPQLHEQKPNRNEHCMKQVWYEVSGGLMLKIRCENKEQVCARLLKVEEIPSMLRGKKSSI